MTKPVWTTFGEGGTLIGVAAATFTAGNAPSAISPQRWIKMTIDGVDGYLPWFSAGTPTGEAGGGGGSGAALLSSGAIASPVAYFDVALPAGYILFDLYLRGFKADTEDYLAV